MDPNWISAIAAIIAVFISFRAYQSAEKSNRRAGELESRNIELAERQTIFTQQSWSDEYFREISAWSSQVSMALSRAIHLVDSGSEEDRREVLITLSACVDMGRWYFPNRDHEREGTDKEPAYRGVRQPCLDWIVLAYNVLDGRRGAPNERGVLVTCQRNFVSCIQEILDPRSRKQAIERALDDFRAVATLPKVESPK